MGRPCTRVAAERNLLPTDYLSIVGNSGVAVNVTVLGKVVVPMVNHNSEPQNIALQGIPGAAAAIAVFKGKP